LSGALLLRAGSGPASVHPDAPRAHTIQRVNRGQFTAAIRACVQVSSHGAGRSPCRGPRRACTQRQEETRSFLKERVLRRASGDSLADLG
jgi:hypothetical protein